MSPLAFYDFCKIAHHFESSYFQIDKSTWHKMQKVQKDRHWKLFSHPSPCSPFLGYHYYQSLMYFPRDSIGLYKLICFYTNGTIIVHTLLYLFSLKVNFGDWSVNNLILFNSFLLDILLGDQYFFNLFLLGRFKAFAIINNASVNFLCVVSVSPPHTDRHIYTWAQLFSYYNYF